MSILLLTIFLSLCLAGLFMVFFWMDFRQREGGSLEQDALLPFADEDSPAPSPEKNPESGHSEKSVRT